MENEIEENIVVSEDEDESRERRLHRITMQRKIRYKIKKSSDTSKDKNKPSILGRSNDKLYSSAKSKYNKKQVGRTYDSSRFDSILDERVRSVSREK